MKAPLTAARANRLAIGLAKSRRVPYEEAEQILRTLTLRVILPERVAHQPAAQAAFLTALNSAQRAFLGGVEARYPEHVPMRLPIPNAQTMREAIALTGVAPVSLPEPTHSVYIGAVEPGARDDDVCAYADSWRAGVSDAAASIAFVIGDEDQLALGGVMAGALAVHRCFVRATRLPARSLDKELGLSLWDPELDWKTPLERKVRNVPTRFWILGLGHLGQAFLWNLALLPYPDHNAVEFLLHDFDLIDESNRGSGLLCDSSSAGKMKTRHCAAWLEARGFTARITERRFGPDDRVGDDEPRIGLCGFDRAPPRVFLDTAGFDLVIECGLGGSLSDFDQADFHVFPSARHTAKGLWGAVAGQKGPVDDSVVRLFAADDQVCGALAIDVAGKSVSTSFVGAIAGAWATAELLRTFNRGPRFDSVVLDGRDSRQWDFQRCSSLLRPSQIAAMGFATL